MYRREGRRLHTKGGTLRYMQKPHRRSGISKKSFKARILLAHHAQRRDRPSQEMQNLPGARQSLSPPIRAINVGHKPLAFPVVGLGYIGTSAHWKEPVQVHHRSSGLFHQMGRSRTSCHYNRTEDTQLCLVIPDMQVWYPQSSGVKQWKAILQS